MSSEEQVRVALRALAEHDRDQEADPVVEARVLRGFRQARKQRMLRRTWVWSAAIAAAAVVLVVWVMNSIGFGPVSPVSVQ